MSGAGRATGRIYTLEAGRFFAALAVVLFHYTALIQDFTGTLILDDAFRGGHAGVPYFFVLSGFIILHVHRADFGRAGAFGDFVRKRTIRLYPMFWLISLPMLAAFVLRPALGGERSLTAGGILADLFLLPRSEAILSISWTLRHEILFYLLFGLALWGGRRFLWLLLPWIAVSVMGGLLHWDAGQLGGLSIVASSLNLGFGLGLLVALRQDERPLLPPGLSFFGGLAAMVLLAILEWHWGAGGDHGVDPLGSFGVFGYLAAAAFLVDGAVRRERHGQAAPPLAGLWSTLGGASYVLYLLHQPFGSLAMRAPLFRHLDPTLAFLLLSISVTLAAVLLHLWVERPLLKRLQGRAGRNRREATAS